MIFVSLNSGGLGNQFFQLNIYFYLQRHYGTSAVSVFFNNRSDFHYGMGLLNLISNDTNITPYNNEKLQNIYKPLDFNSGNVYLKYIIWFLNKLRRSRTSKRLKYDPIISPIAVDTFVDFIDIIDPDKDYIVAGLFQNSYYINSNLEFLKSQINFTQDCVNSNSAQYDLNISCIIHIRGGNFLNSLSHNIIGQEYYTKAIKYMEIVYNIKTFVILSDDIAHAKKIFKNKEMHFVTNSSPNSYLFDFNLIKGFKYAIIPNSTYSLWVRLMSNTNELTIFPEYFYKNNSIYQTFSLDKQFKHLKI